MRSREVFAVVGERQVVFGIEDVNHHKRCRSELIVTGLSTENAFGKKGFNAFSSPIVSQTKIVNSQQKSKFLSLFLTKSPQIVL